MADVLGRVLTPHRDSVQAALKTAVEHNLIADLDTEMTVDRLQTLRIEHLSAQPFRWSAPLAPPDEDSCCTTASLPTRLAEESQSSAVFRQPAVGPSRVANTPFRDVLAISVSDPAVQRQVIQALADHDGNMDLRTVLDGVAGLSPEQRADLGFTLEATAALRSHPRLVNHGVDRPARLPRSAIWHGSTKPTGRSCCAKPARRLSRP